MSALKALFGAVAATANTVTTAVGAVTQVVEMGTDSIAVARTKQKARHVLDQVDYVDQLLEEKAAETAVRQAKIRELCMDETFKTDYVAAESKFAAALTAHGLLKDYAQPKA